MELESLFNKVFSRNVESIYRAPARINLIGEHIDYNGGKVLPCAISCYIKGLVSKREDNKIVCYSTNFNDQHECSLDLINYDKSNNWANYVFGVFNILLKHKYKIPFGLNIMVDSNIPLGSGLSSSAALLDLVCYIANDQYKLGIDLKTIAKLALKTENEFCGLKCGIMDEAAIALGKENKAILLDCAKFEYEYKPICLNDYSFVVLKTNKPRNLVESKYNERVEECQSALSIIKTKYKIDNLCELKVEDLEDVKSLLNNNLLFKRVRHVVSENERVSQFVKAMEEGDVYLMGCLLCESHNSLRDDYEVTGAHLDTIFNAAIQSGAIGARMTGAGFGGCAIALIKTEEFSTFKKSVSEHYFSKIGIHPDVLKVDIVDGPNKIK